MMSFDQLKGAAILVTGGAGFVGSNLVKKLLSFDAKKVTVIDNLLSAEKANVPNDSRITFIHGSVCDDAVMQQVQDEFDYIFHLVTYHGNQSSILDPMKDHDNNTLPTLKLCERIKEFKNLKKVVYSSAGCTVAEKTFGDVKATTEESPVSLYLDSPYQLSKIFGEFYFNYYWRRYGLPIVKARFQNVYGPGEILGAGEWRGSSATVWRNVTPTFVYRAIKGMKLTVENGGIATRDFIFVDDITDGLILCALNGTVPGVYNIASGVETSILDLANLIIELTDANGAIDYTPPRDWDRSGKRYGSTDKSQQELGFCAKVDIREGLQKTIRWTKENIDLIDATIHKHKDRYSL